MDLRVTGLAQRMKRGTINEIFDFMRFESDLDPDANGVDSNAAGVAVAPDKTIWVSDAAGNWVAHLSSNGDLLMHVVFPPIDGEDAVPTGIFIGGDGSAYVTLFRCSNQDANQGGVARINPDGNYELVASGLRQPIDVAIDNNDAILGFEFSESYRRNSGRLISLEGVMSLSEKVIFGLFVPSSAS